MRNKYAKQIWYGIGDPMTHSLGALVHPAALEAMGLSNKFGSTVCDVKAEDLEAAIMGLRALDAAGSAVTLPHKVAVMQYMDEIDPMAKKIGAVNTVIVKDKRLIGYNTDVDGILTPLKKRTEVLGKNVLLLGAGGAARAAAFALVDAGAKVTIVNRTFEKAEKLARDSKANVETWEKRTDLALKSEIIFNATALGFDGSSEAALGKEAFHAGQIVFDAVYNPYDTPLLKNAAVATVIHGSEMYVGQAAKQILLYTGMEAPVELMEKVLLRELNG